MSATETPPRLRVSPDALSVVVSAYAAMTEALGPLWTCRVADGRVTSRDGDPRRPVLHRLVRWRAEVES